MAGTSPAMTSFAVSCHYGSLHFEFVQEKWRTSARPPNSPAIESTTEPIT